MTWQGLKQILAQRGLRADDVIDWMGIAAGGHLCFARVRPAGVAPTKGNPTFDPFARSADDDQQTKAGSQ